jgi:hypothetical protein
MLEASAVLLNTIHRSSARTRRQRAIQTDREIILSRFQRLDRPLNHSYPINAESESQKFLSRNFTFLLTRT